MNEHALETLEFHKVRELLAERCASERGRRLASEVAPRARSSEAEELLAETRETLDLKLAEPSWGPVGFPDVGQLLARARIEGFVAEPLALTELATVLERATSVASVFRRPGFGARYPRLASLARRLLVAPEFAARLRRSLGPDGEVLDEASRELAQTRRRLLATRQRISAFMERMSRRLDPAGEDSVVTLRGGRYVVSVPASLRSRVEGIVHDRSASGRTLYVEPFEAVDLNNELADLEADERREVQRILAELTSWVRRNAGALEQTLQILAHFDEIGARAQLALDLKASRPRFDAGCQTLRLVGLRHPLLIAQMGFDRVVASTVELGNSSRGLVVSGPNMGGKTALLKAVGLAVLMALSGLYVPASEGSIVPWVEDVFVDLGDEQSLESDLSTYAGHLRNMKSMLLRADSKSLVLIDELGAGTDPEEGAALGMALLEHLGQRRCLCLVTTHLGAFKVFASTSPGFVNAAMEFDPSTLRPTYRLKVGIPGRSRAFELAQREGWPRQIMERARSYLSSDRRQADDLLEQIERHLIDIRSRQVEVERARMDLETEREKVARLGRRLRERMESVELEREMERDRRLRELGRLIGQLRRRLEQMEPATPEQPAADELAAQRRWLHSKERRVARLRKAASRRRKVRAPGPRLSPERLKPGTVAYCGTLGEEVQIESLRSSGDRAWVRSGGIRLQVSTDDLFEPESRLPGGSQDTQQRTKPLGEPSRTGPVVSGERLRTLEEMGTVSPEIDLRGMRAEEAVGRLDLYLDRAALAGLERVRILHGKGRGVLRQRVREFLEADGRILSFRDGRKEEGDWGVTIAHLRS